MRSDSTARCRLSTHGVAFSLVSAALIIAAISSPAAAGPSAGSTTELTMSSASLGQVPLPISNAPVPTLTQGADQTLATVRFDPRLGLPHWLHATRDLQLWSAGDASATAAASIPAGTSYVKPLGPFGDTRIEVYFPGDANHPSAQAWVDTAALEPSDIPSWIAPPAGPHSQDRSTASPLAPQRTGDAPPPDTTAIHIAIVDDASGQLIYGEQPFSEVPQASTTKIATTIVALERSPDLNKRIDVTISASAMVARDGSSTMGIEPGRSVSLDTLLHGMMLPSGNDAAEQVAVSLGGTREHYVQWMNDEADALGLKDTHFINPSGMDADGHYSSAYDMAMLARYAMRNPTFRELARATHYSGDGFNMGNLNRLLDLYAGADGVKIGYTDAAQKTIVASAVHDGRRVYVSLMHSADLVGDSSALFDWVWANFTW